MTRKQGPMMMGTRLGVEIVGEEVTNSWAISTPGRLMEVVMGDHSGENSMLRGYHEAP